MPRFLIFFFVLLFTSCRVTEQTQSTQLKRTSQQETALPESFGSQFEQEFQFDAQNLDQYLTLLYQKNKWQGSVAILHDGKAIYLKALGKLAMNSDRLADSGTKYRIGSITKVYISALIHDLVADGKLKWTTTLDQFFPKLPNAESITMEQMLRHTSGLANYVDELSFSPIVSKTEQEVLDFIHTLEPNHSPGEVYEYSNTNYFLLAAIVEEVTGKSYQEQMEQVILAPRKLASTSVTDNDVQVNQNEASSFIFNHDTNQWTQVPAWDLTNAKGAGDITATASDVAGFLSDLFTEKIINAEQVNSLIEMDAKGRGKGLFILPFGNKVSYGHTGGLEGYRSMASYFPEEKISWAILSNGVDTNLNDIAIGVLSIVYNKPFELPTFDASDKVVIENIDAYLGTYQSDGLPIDISITQEDGQLFARATGQSRFPLTKTEEGSFTFPTAGIIINFKRLEQGKYQAFSFFQGKTFEFTRKEEE